MTIEEMRSLDAEKTYKELMWERSEVLRLTTTNLQLREGVETLKQRIHQLEAENDAMRADLLLWEQKERVYNHALAFR